MYAQAVSRNIILIRRQDMMHEIKYALAFQSDFFGTILSILILTTILLLASIVAVPILIISLRVEKERK